MATHAHGPKNDPNRGNRIHNPINNPQRLKVREVRKLRESYPSLEFTDRVTRREAQRIVGTVRPRPNSPDPRGFERFRIPKKGKPTGVEGKERTQSLNPKLSKEALEREVKQSLQERYSEFVIEDRTGRAGLDYAVLDGKKEVALADAKSSLVVSKRQWLEINKAVRERGVPCFLIGHDWYFPITPENIDEIDAEPNSFKLSRK